MHLIVHRLDFDLTRGIEAVLILAPSDDTYVPLLELRVFVAAADSLAVIRQRALDEGYRMLAQVLQERPT